MLTAIIQGKYYGIVHYITCIAAVEQGANNLKVGTNEKEQVAKRLWDTYLIFAWN